MNFKNSLLVFCAILCIILSASCVCASDVNDTQTASEETTLNMDSSDDALAIGQSDEDVLSDGDKINAEIIDYPKNYGENQVTFKLTDKTDNTPLANIDLGIMSYLPEKKTTAPKDDKLGAELNSKPLTFMPDIYNLTKITTNSNGIAVYTIPDMFKEDFRMHAGFYIDDGVSTYTEATINGVKKDIYIDYFDIYMTSVIAKATLKLSKEGTYYSDMLLKVSLIANNNRAIPNETIQVTFSNGKKVNIITNSNGMATYTIPFDVGTYSATAKTVSKKIISNSTKLDNIVISKAPVTISAAKLSTTYASGKYFQINVINANTKKAVANVKLSLKAYTGNKYKTVTVTTDSKGVAKYSASSLSVGTHKIAVSIKDTKNCVGSSKSSSIKITKSGVAISAPSQYAVFNKGPSFKVTVKNKASKKSVAGITVTAKIYTGTKYKTLTAKTNSKGIATFSTKGFSKGKHAIKISTKANANYLSGSAKSSMNVLASKITTYLIVTQGIRFIIGNSGWVVTSAIATLRDINGKELFKPIKVHSLNHGTTTETSGSTIPIRLSYSEAYTFRYAGDSLYKPATITHYITVS